MYYLGIDGGGTKTSFVLINDTNYTITTALLPSCSPAQYGFDGFEKIITEGVNSALKDAGAEMASIKAACLGVPGFTESIEGDEIILGIVSRVFGGVPWKCVNDVEVGWAGSLGLKPGINIVAGTGAIAFGRDSSGNTARSSGWGEFFGDEGSCHWLGIKALQYFSKQADGRLPKGALYDLMKSRIGIERDLDFMEYFEKNLMGKRDKIAKLQIILCDAAEAGDKTAVQAYNLAAQELTEAVSAVVNALKFSDGIDVSYSGGAFKAGKLILNPLKDQLSAISMDLTLKQPLLSPVSGAVLLAAENAQEPDVDSIMQHLRIFEENNK
jgi:N-acetylglucosamine kinase-like BadF-type ATPase